MLLRFHPAAKRNVRSCLIRPGHVDNGKYSLHNRSCIDFLETIRLLAASLRFSGVFKITMLNKGGGFWESFSKMADRILPDCEEMLGKDSFHPLFDAHQRDSRAWMRQFPIAIPTATAKNLLQKSTRQGTE